MRWTAWMVAAPALLVAAGGSAADTGLELIDGRVLEGVDIERTGDAYLLKLASGASIVVPSALVREVRLIVEEPESPIPEELPPAETPSEVETESSPDALPVVAPVRRPYEQLAVFGPQRPIVARNNVDPSWWPASDWRQENVENEFDPSRWSDTPISPRWEPRESFDHSRDWATSPSARWARPPIGAAWWPREGFPDVDSGPESD